MSAVAAPHPVPFIVRLGPIMFAVMAGLLVVGLALPVLPLHVSRDLGFNSVMVGVVASCQFAAALASRFWAGGVADRFGGKQALCAGLAVAAVSGALYLASLLFVDQPVVSVSILLAGRATLGGAESFIITGALAWGMTIVESDTVAKVISWVGVALYAAFAIGAPLGSMVDHRFGFTGIAAATLILPLLGWLYVAFRSAPPPVPAPRTPIRSVISAVWEPGLALALASLGFGAVTTFMVLLFDSRGWGLSWLAFTAFAGAFILVRAILGGLPDKLGGARIALICIVIEAIGLAVVALAADPILGIIGAAVTGLGYSLVYPGLGVEAVRRAPANARGMAMGAYTASIDLALGFAGPSLGLVAVHTGYGMVFGVSAAVVAASGLVAWRLWRQARATTGS